MESLVSSPEALLNEIEASLGQLSREQVNVAPQAEGKRSHKTKISLLSVLIPVYNERWTVENVIAKVLRAPISLPIEIIVVDDGSTDGTAERLEELAADEPRLCLIRHPQNRGKGAAVLTAIQNMSGDVAIVQDADLEYDPVEFPKLLEPILRGEADAVFGSRYAANTTRKVLPFWHSLINAGLTLCSNLVNDQSLTDMETCYKAIRADVLKRLNLRSQSFGFEPELTSRLAQWGARIYEVPIGYVGRSVDEGKKIRPSDGIKALWELFRCRVVDPQFTDHSGFYILKSVAKAARYNRWLIEQCKPFLGPRLLEAGAGIGNLSTLLTRRERLVLVDYDAEYVRRLDQRFGSRPNIRTLQADLTDPLVVREWYEEKLDTVFCSNVLEHLGPDEQVLKTFRASLQPGGHCVVIVPAEPKLFTGMDQELGHYRRYTESSLRDKMERCGFKVVHSNQFCKVGALAWWLTGNLLRKRHLSPRQMIWFDRLWPITRRLDAILPTAGMSLMMIGRREE